MKKPNSIKYTSQFSEIGTITASVQTLFDFSQLPDGETRAYNYLLSVFDAKSCSFLKILEQSETHLQKRLEGDEKAVAEALREFKNFQEAPGIADLEKDHMPPGERRINKVRVIAIIVLTVLGTLSFMSLLQNSGETLADSSWKAAAIALTANFTLGIGIKLLISFPTGKLQNAIAGTVCFFGVVAGLTALTGNAVLYAPTSQEDEKNLIEKILSFGDEDASDNDAELDEGWEDSVPQVNDTPTDTIIGWDEVEPTVEADQTTIPADEPRSQDGIWDLFLKHIGTVIFISTVIAESFLSAVLAFFWARTRKAYRDSALQDKAEYKEHKERCEETTKHRNDTLDELLPVRGKLEAVAAERTHFTEIGLAKILTLKG